MNTRPTRVLLVDDEATFRTLLQKELSASGFEVEGVGSGPAALEKLGREDFDVMLLDMRMPGLSGLQVLERLQGRSGLKPKVVILTGQGVIDDVVSALRLGAYDYLTKPCALAELEVVLRRAALARDRRLALPKQTVHGLITVSPAMVETVALIDKVAPTEATVLLEGESGTGKELLVQRLHQLSGRAGKPFVVVNCGTIEEGLFLSELFGHEKGAFTGATGLKHGLVEQAHTGTLFLDEVGELSLEAQVRLLRFMQFGEFRRVGATATKVVDVRVIGATNRQLAAACEQGTFRLDLYYRLTAIHVCIPPLRDRLEALPAFVSHFQSISLYGEGRMFAPDALALLATYAWPGNVRELQNIVERILILADGPEIDAQTVLTHFDGLARYRNQRPSSGAQERLTLREVERRTIEAAMVRLSGDKPAVASELGIALKTLYNKLNAYAEEPA